MDRTDVTSEEFARFVKATGYLTLAERPLNPKDFPERTGRAGARLHRVHASCRSSIAGQSTCLVEVRQRRELASSRGS